MVYHYEAVEFRKPMASGRTRPALVSCVREQQSEEVEFILKFKTDTTPRGLARELISSCLAGHFEIPTPEPAIVHISKDFAESARDETIRNRLLENLGTNFGSRYIRSKGTYPKRMRIDKTLLHQAMTIFAFDVLIQNPDRRVDNPNILMTQNKLFCFDHEMALAFSQVIGNRVCPWEGNVLAGEKYLQDHVFRSQLKGKEINLDRFGQQLAACRGRRLTNMVDMVPEEWRTEEIGMIAEYLGSASLNADRFVASVTMEVQR